MPTNHAMLSDMKDWQKTIAGSLLLLVAACTIPNGPSSWQEEKGNSMKEILVSNTASLGETCTNISSSNFGKKSHRVRNNPRRN
jgi:hypothetical protein